MAAIQIRSGEKGGKGGKAVDVGSLALEDFHVLRALATHAGWLAEEPVEGRCRNCSTPFSVVPSRVLETGPFRDGELDDPELDAAFPFEDALPIPALRIGRREASTLVLVPRTLAEARPLFAALDRGVLRITSEIVRAMGIQALGDERSAVRMARALQNASDESWSAIVGHFDAAHYSPRLQAWITCVSCGARNEVDAPGLREFPVDPRGPSAEMEEELSRGFPELEGFERMVQREAERAYEGAGVDRESVDLLVVPGVADCDEGGAPLLGSYSPPQDEDHGVLGHRPEVRIYYRTFRAMLIEDGPYDVLGEIRETLEHELEHHRAFLRGDDPVDREERGEIWRDVQRQVGERESLRRASRNMRSDPGEFLRRTWVIWLVLAGITWWTATR